MSSAVKENMDVRGLLHRWLGSRPRRHAVYGRGHHRSAHWWAVAAGPACEWSQAGQSRLLLTLPHCSFLLLPLLLPPLPPSLPSVFRSVSLPSQSLHSFLSRLTLDSNPFTFILWDRLRGIDFRSFENHLG